MDIAWRKGSDPPESTGNKGSGGGTSGAAAGRSVCESEYNGLMTFRGGGLSGINGADGVSTRRGMLLELRETGVRLDDNFKEAVFSLEDSIMGLEIIF